MMNQDMTTRIYTRNQGSSWRGLSVALTMLVALALMTTAAFALSGGDAYSAARAGWTIRADANPSMDVVLWYVPAQVSSVLSRSAVAGGEDLDLSGLHARNFAELLAREADEAAVAESSQEMAGLHARNFAELLAREADEAAVAESSQAIAGLHARNFAELLARETDEAAVAESNQDMAGLHARNFAELLARETDEAAVAESNQECAIC